MQRIDAPDERPRTTIFLSAGDPSGDLHGANLARALMARGPVDCVGFGGPRMAQAGCRLDADLTALAVMWIARALLNLHRFLWLLWQADRCFRRQRPDAVVLIDFPGFNWWVARRAKAHGIPVYYYAPPQLWGWGGWRVKKMRRYVDRVLCALPFEQKWFHDRGCNATYVGHPYFDEVRRHKLDADFVADLRRQPGRLVTILPGSRTQEVADNLDMLLNAAELIRQAVPGVRFAIAGYKPSQAGQIRRALDERKLTIPVYVGATPELIHAADCCLAVSGSVSLELLYHTRPTVIVYAVSRLMFVLQHYIRKVKYITLVNLLTSDDIFTDTTLYDRNQPGAKNVLFPEYLTHADKSRAIAAHAIEWLTDEPWRQRRVAELAAWKARLCQGGASETAAELILAELTGPSKAGPARSTAQFPAAGTT